MKSLALVAVLAFWATAPASATVARGKAAPAFTMAATDGGRVALARLRGKSVYLNFFASWCGPCNDEAPVIARLQEKYRSRGLVVVGVDELENLSRATQFKQKYHLPYAVAIDDGAVAKPYGVIALPVHVFIDRAGTVKLFRLGEMSDAEIEAAIVSIL
jgi:peroxiredoxin